MLVGAREERSRRRAKQKASAGAGVHTQRSRRVRSPSTKSTAGICKELHEEGYGGEDTDRKVHGAASSTSKAGQEHPVSQRTP